VRKVIKSECKFCGNREFETIKDRVVRNLKLTGYIFLIMIIFGNFFLYYYLSRPEQLYKFGSVVGFFYTYGANHNDKELRDLAINLTRGCEANTYCSALYVYLAMKDFNYFYAGESGTILYPSLETYNNKGGNCQDLAYTYASILHQVGVEAYVKCEFDHCWNIVKTTKGIYIVDLTESVFEPAFVQVSNET